MWVGGVADSQTWSKPLINPQIALKIALFDLNFTLRSPKSPLSNTENTISSPHRFNFNQKVAVRSLSDLCFVFVNMFKAALSLNNGQDIRMTGVDR